MTSASSNLLAVRTLLLNALGSHGLASAEVGIVGDVAHDGGYHCGADRVDDDDYSVRESSRDRTGLTSHASALDVGTFSYGSHNLRTFSVWCVKQCQANTPDTRDIREIIYSPDGTTVKRWDRLGKRTTGDTSHRGHTHFSFFRDATKAGRDQTPLFRRYLMTIGLPGEVVMLCELNDKGEHVKALQVALNYLGFDAGTEDGEYGPKTSAAVLRMRKSVGSTAKSGDRYDPWAYFQLHMCIAKKYGGK